MCFCNSRDMVKVFLCVASLIGFWTGIYAESVTNTSVVTNSDQIGNAAAIHQHDVILTKPTSDDVINTISSSDKKQVGKRFELILSKLGPLGSLFLGIHKSGRFHALKGMDPVSKPISQSMPPELIFQDGHGPQLHHSNNQPNGQQDYFHQFETSQQHPPLHYQPSLELTIKGPPVPNLEPLINAFPGVLAKGYKSFLNKISSTSIVWDKSINLPFISIQKSGRIGASGTGPQMATILGPPSQPSTPVTSLVSSGIFSGHIDSLVDIRDPYIT